MSRAIKRGEARRIARGIVTTNAHSPLEQVVRRNWAPIAAHLVPGATVVDRSFFNGGPARDGTVVLDVGPDGTRRTAPITLPGLRIVTRVGPGPVFWRCAVLRMVCTSGQVRTFSTISSRRGREVAFGEHSHAPNSRNVWPG